MFGTGVMEIWILAALALIVVVALLPGGSRYDVADEAVAQGVSVEAADQVLFRELSDVRGLALTESHAGSYTLTRTSRSAWAVVAAIFLFPIGLVFLLITREERIQVSLAAHPSGCRVRVVGHARRRDIDQVSSAIERVLPVPVVAR